MFKFLFFLNLVFSTHAYAVGKIELRSEVKVRETRMLTLGDVANLENIETALADKIKAVILGQAPQIGETHSYTSVFLSGLLRKALVEVPVNLKEQWSIRIPSKMSITNEGLKLSPQAIEEKLQTHWKNICGNCKFLVLNLITPQIPANLHQSPWDLRLSDSLPRGQFTNSLEIRDSSGQIFNFWVKGQVQIQTQVPVATRAINFGERLSAADFVLQWKDTTFAYDSAPSAEKMIGRKVTRSLRNGDMIFTGLLEKEKAMKRGDIVKVILSEDNWRISMTGVAEEDGSIGDTVKVRSEKTKRQMSGVVNAEGEVVVR